MKFTYPGGSRPLEGYTLKRGVGQGGFGEVYYATSDAGKEVALKLIRRNLDVELRGVTQCLNLKHPNLVALYDMKIDERGDNWVIMEYVAGESLEDTLARHPTGMPVAEALLWFHGIAAGVAYLHDRGIVHRDLKPGNIFNDDGQVKIGDYGLSKFISASRRSGQTESVGTVHYMAPEIANGRYGKEIDLYALGVILYELLSGQVPFEGESVGEVLMKHLTAEPDVTRVPAPYRELVARALAKDPERRPHSVAEFLAALPPGDAPAAVPPRLAPSARPEPFVDEPVAVAPQSPPARPVAEDLGIPRIPPVRMPGGAAPIAGSAAASARAPNGWDKFLRWWHSLPFPARAALAFAAAIIILRLVPAFLINVGTPNGRGEPSTLVIIVVAIVVVVGLRRAARRSPKSGPAAPAPLPARERAQATPKAQGEAVARNQISPAVLEPAPPLPRPRVVRQEMLLAQLAAKSNRDRVTELLGSLLVAAGVSVAAALLMLVVQRSAFQPAYAWVALCGTLGAWGVLVPAKLWEGREGDNVLRRFAMLGIGLAFSLAAYEAGSFLRIILSDDVRLPHVDINVPDAFDEHGQPAVMSYLAYFGLLFFAVRWWRQADPLRATRLSLVSVAVCLLWAVALNLIWQFPQPWGLLVAGTISVAVQLSSPWLDPRNRGARAAASR